MSTNSLITAVVGVVGGVVHDQGEADDDMSVKQRLLLAGGSTLAEGSGAVRDLTGVDAAADVLEVAGEKREREEATSLLKIIRMGRQGGGEVRLGGQVT